MRCARCGADSQGASWYCANCGAPLEDLNVADTVAPNQLPPVLRYALGLTAVGLVVVALAGLGGLAVRVLRPGPDPDAGAVVETATPGGDATEVVAAGPTGGGTASGGGEAAPTAAPLPTQGSEPPTALPTARPDTAVPSPRTPVDVLPTAEGDRVAGSPGEGDGEVPVREGAPVWRVGRTDDPPRLDGRLEEWPPQVEIAAVVFGQEHWSGPGDLSARASAMWDDRSLYLGVQVIDDFFSQPSAGRELYLGDSLELQLDVDLAADYADSAYGGDDWQIGVSPGNFAARGPESYTWRPAGSAVEGLAVASRRLESGYVVELALPWSSVGFDPGATRSLGLTVNVSDNDDPRPAQLSMIALSPTRSWADPRSFATVVLEARGE